jgi:hypothetical protein
VLFRPDGTVVDKLPEGTESFTQKYKQLIFKDYGKITLYIGESSMILFSFHV